MNKDFLITCKYQEVGTKIKEFIKKQQLKQFALTIQLTDCSKSKAILIYNNGDYIWL